MSSKFMEEVLRLGELGYRLLPCVPGAKVPQTEHGLLDATNDAGQLDQWWTRCPNANVAMVTDKLVAIDIDGKQNPWLAQEPDKLLELTGGAMSLTPRGGSHRIFRQPAGKNWRCTQGKLAPGVDTRANGGYVVVPPSVLKDHGPYGWAEGLELDVPPEQLPEPPEWLAETLDEISGTNGSPSARSAVPAAGNTIPEGQRNSTLARLAGSMRRVGMTEAEILAALLQTNEDRCQPLLSVAEVQRIARSVSRYEPDQTSVALAENHWAQLCEEAARAEDNPDPGPVPPSVFDIPGFVSQVMQHTLETAPYPEPVLAFCGALALQAFLAGRKVRDEADNRTNLYILGLANSGAGKEHPRKVNQQVLLECGLAEALGDAFASGEGIEDRLFDQNALLFQTDEIDGLVIKLNEAGDARHENIMNTLLKLYTSSSSLYPMRAKAGTAHRFVEQPSLCIFGTAIPKHYYEALSVKMLTNGFFARMLVLEAGKRSQGQDAVVQPLPGNILETARWWANNRPGRNGNLGWQPVPRVVAPTDEAASLLREIRQRADAEYSRAEGQGDQVAMAIWARACEKARRLALIYACSESHQQPRITPAAVQWAGELADYQTRRMLFMASQYVSENEFHGRCRRLVALLRDWRDSKGDEWMPYWQISRKLPWTAREHEEVRAALLNQQTILYTERKTGGPTQRLYRLP